MKCCSECRYWDEYRSIRDNSGKIPAWGFCRKWHELNPKQEKALWREDYDCLEFSPKVKYCDKCGGELK